MRPDFEDEWLVWRIIKESNFQISLKTIESEWTLDDVLKANALLDMDFDYSTAELGLSAMKKDVTS